MANTGGFLAHLVKFIVTIFCIKYRADESLILSQCAYQIFLIHSIVGMFRFGSTGGVILKRSFRKSYDVFSNIVEIIPFAMISTEILHHCAVDDIIRQSLLFVLCILPIVHDIIPKNEREKIKKLLNYAINLQLIIVIYACLNNGSISCINLVISYIFNRYFVDIFCDWFDIPYDDLSQYSLSFVEIFSVTTLKELI